MSTGEQPSYHAVLFDLLSGLLDSWTLWNAVAGGAEVGRWWRAAYLRNTYATGRYRSYEELVAEAAAEVGLSPDLAGELARRYGEIEPWPETPPVLHKLRERVPLAVVTNCSEALGAKAIAATGIDFDVTVTAERAGFYKPDVRPYRMALEELGLSAAECLFVAGSPFDLYGTAKVGIPTFWHNRSGLTAPPDAPRPLFEHRLLDPLVELIETRAR